MKGHGEEFPPAGQEKIGWNSTQAPHRVKAYLAQALDQPADSIRVVAPDVGGSFGMKDCICPEDVLVPYLSVMLRRPIKWIENRQENLLSYHGRGQSLDMEIRGERK